MSVAQSKQFRDRFLGRFSVSSRFFATDKSAQLPSCASGTSPRPGKSDD